MSSDLNTAEESTVRLLDGLVLFWVMLWLVVGVWTGVIIWQVADVGDTISTSGNALESAGTALAKLSSVPVVGDDAGALGEDVLSTGSEVSDRGLEVKSQLRQLSVLLGIAIVLMPTTPVVGLYLPRRMARRREIASLRTALSLHAEDPTLDRYLAERAVAHLPFTTLNALSPDPWADLARGDSRRLANAELQRLGLGRQGA